MAVTGIQFAAFPLAAQADGPAPQQPQNLVRTIGRLVIVVPPRNLKVAEANEITLRIHPPGLTSVIATQARRSNAEGTVSGVEGGEQEVPVLHHPDGSAYIRLVPMALGEVGLRLTGVFSDGEFNWADATLHVGPSDRKPVALILDHMDLERIRLNLDDPEWANGAGGRKYLNPEAYYLDVRAPVPVDGFVQYTVRQPAGAPVIDFAKSTGGMKPVRRGDALLEASFSGAVTRMCIQVRSSGDLFDRGTCRQLHAAASPTPPSPLNATWSQDPDGVTKLDLSRGIEFFTERLTVTAPDQPVDFGQPLQIPVSVSGGKLRTLIFIQQASGRDDPHIAPNWITGQMGHALSGGQAKIARDDGSSKTIDLVPLVFGEEKVAIGARFEDGGFSEKYFRLHVRPSAKGLQSFSLSDWPTADGRHLIAHLRYAQLANRIELSTLEGIKLTVEQPTDAPVLRVEPDGMVHESRAGDAVIVAEFDGVQARYPIRVSKGARPRR